MAEKMTALIFGAIPSKNWEYLQNIHADLVICADGGVLCAEAAGVKPDLLIGDWDSGGKPVSDVPSVSMPPDKDLTDLQAAAEAAMERGCRNITFCGCLGGRLDMTAINLTLLEWCYDRGCQAVLLDDGNEARMWDGSRLELDRDDRYRYLSIVPLDRRIEGVTLEGVKYPLKNGNLTRGDTLTVSNEFAADKAIFTAQSGRSLVIRCRRFIKT